MGEEGGGRNEEQGGGHDSALVHSTETIANHYAYKGFPTYIPAMDSRLGTDALAHSLTSNG